MERNTGRAQVALTSPMNHYALYQSHGTGKSKWDSAISSIIDFSCAFTAIFFCTTTEHFLSSICLGETILNLDAFSYIKDADIQFLMTACATCLPVWMRDGYDNKDKKRGLFDCYSLCRWLVYVYVFFPSVQMFALASIWVWVCVRSLRFCVSVYMFVCPCQCMLFPLSSLAVCVSLSGGGAALMEAVISNAVN